MRIILTVFFSLFFVQFTLSQKWELKETLDQFGDKTGNKRYSLRVNGSFNNSAQTGSRAILFLSFSGSKYSEFDESLGSLLFEVYEYNNNPADFNRKSETIDVVMKNGVGKIFRGEIMTNEFSDDNVFSMSQYLDPLSKIKERTQKKYSDIYTYQLIEPTYDVDFEIINQIIYKSQVIKLNIYSGRSEYYFKFKSLGLNFPKYLQQKINEVEIKKTRKKEVLNNLLSNLMVTEYDKLSQKNKSILYDYLNEYPLERLEQISAVSFDLSGTRNSNLDYNLNVFLNKKSGSIEKLDFVDLALSKNSNFIRKRDEEYSKIVKKRKAFEKSIKLNKEKIIRSTYKYNVPEITKIISNEISKQKYRIAIGEGFIDLKIIFNKPEKGKRKVTSLEIIMKFKNREFKRKISLSDYDGISKKQLKSMGIKYGVAF